MSVTIDNEIIFYKSWFDAGVHVIGDLPKTDGQFYSFRK